MAFRIVSLFLILIFTSCEELEVDQNNIFEADADQQIPDVTNLNTNINGATVDFSWEGNDFALEFSYMVEYYIDSDKQVWKPYYDWSDWGYETDLTLNNLDEGLYSFQVKSRFGNVEELEEDSYQSTNFEIDNINGPTLRIYPLNQTANPGDEIDVYLYFEDVPQELSVTGLQIDIQINTDELQFINDQFVLGELVDDFPGTIIYPDPYVSEDGSFVSIMGVADSSGTGIYGTGPIAKIRLSVKDEIGNFQILIYQEEDAFQDINGNWHGFNDPVSGSVKVEEVGQ